MATWDARDWLAGLMGCGRDELTVLSTDRYGRTRDPGAVRARRPVGGARDRDRADSRHGRSRGRRPLARLRPGRLGGEGRPERPRPRVRGDRLLGTMSGVIDARPGGVRGRLARTLPILPVLLAEAILWLGFGALLPVLPLYITEQGIDTATLGWIVAAWPAARLLGEPLFGWLADRGDKRLLMLAGLVATAVVVPMPLVLTGVAGLPAGAGPRRPRHGRLRSGRPGLHPRRHAPRGARCGIRPLRLGPDGRPAAGAGLRWRGRGARRRLRLPLRLLQRGPRRRRRAPGTDDLPSPGASPRRRRDNRRAGRRRRAAVALEPAPPGGHRHQRGELLRLRDLRGHLEPLDGRAGRRHRPDRSLVRGVRPGRGDRLALRRPVVGPARPGAAHRRRQPRRGAGRDPLHGPPGPGPGHPRGRLRGRLVRPPGPGPLRRRGPRHAGRPLGDDAGRLRGGGNPGDDRGLDQRRGALRDRRAPPLLHVRHRDGGGARRRTRDRAGRPASPGRRGRLAGVAAPSRTVAAAEEPT